MFKVVGFFSGENIKNVNNFVFLNLDNINVSTIPVGMQYTLFQFYSKPPFWLMHVPLQALSLCLIYLVLGSWGLPI